MKNSIVGIFLRVKHSVRLFVEYPFKKLFSYRFLHERKRIHKPSYFLDNSKGSDTICVILSGYKEFAWDCVFERIKKFCPTSIDVCIVSSGKYVERLKEIAVTNGWSYVAMKRNNVCLALNSSIQCFPKAKHVFKLDEDILVTENFFEVLPKTHELAKEDFVPGFTAPLINVNCFCYRKILEKLDLVDDFTQRFEHPRMYGFAKIGSDLNIAKYMWGEGGIVPQLDALNRDFSGRSFAYDVCPVRFSIGAIYYDRATYGILPVYAGNDLGTDEVVICSKAASDWLAMIVANNVVVGHLSYSPQNKGMEEYFKMHPEVFYLQSK